MRGLQGHPKILTGGLQLGPYPMESLKHVDKPTNIITENIQRIDVIRQAVFGKARRGDFGTAVQKKWVKMSIERDPLTDSIRDVIKRLGPVNGNGVAPATAPLPKDPAVLSRHIKRLGYFLKADIVGICELPETAVYSHDQKGNPVTIDHKYAIVIVMQKDHRTIKASTGHDWISDALSFQCYERLAVTAEIMADYIRRLGYPAVAQHSQGCSVQMPPLLLWAGIGEVSRAGIILNPFLGLNYKAAVILTDIPLAIDKPIDFGLQDFCQRCKKCAEMCPSKAISAGDKVMYNGYETWKLKDNLCGSFVIMNNRGLWCNNCVKVCPWTQPNTWPHNAIRWAVQRSALARRVAIKADQLFGHTKGCEPEKWWFDLHYEDGVIRLPSHGDDSHGKQVMKIKKS